MNSLPILDISGFLKAPFSASAQEFSERLVAACHDPGFFYLRGHGVENSDNLQMMDLARAFFALPEGRRHEIAIGKSPHFRGYTILGDERTRGKRDWREQIDIGPEEPALVPGENDPPWLRLRGPNQWPRDLPQMPAIVNGWADQMRSLALEMFRALAMGLQHDYHYFDHLMTPDPYFRIKISRYPAQAENSNPCQGLGWHQDSGLFTFIMQHGATGLQVERKGAVYDVEPVPEAYIVNLGEMFQIATNGFLKATRHQVRSPATGDRISVAYFMNPRLDAVFKPIPLPDRFAMLAGSGQNTDQSDPVYATFGENTLKIRMRSHPDIKSAFYSDVILQAEA